MSRIGKQPITLPKGVEIHSDGKFITVKGPKGTLKQACMPGINVEVKGNEVIITVDEKLDGMSKFHGLYRALVANMIEGVTKGFEKKLELQGVGYRAAVQGQMLDLQLGFSHPTKEPIPEGLHVVVEKKNTQIIVQGINKQQVGEFAAKVRAIKPPEPYQGKGIRYEGEYVRRKQGKAAAKK